MWGERPTQQTALITCCYGSHDAAHGDRVQPPSELRHPWHAEQHLEFHFAIVYENRAGTGPCAVLDAPEGLSDVDIPRACESASKNAILDDRTRVGRAIC